MNIGIVSLFPQMFEAVTRYGVTGRALDRGLLGIRTVNPRDFCRDRHRSVDDRPYGGGPGMVMAVEPLRTAIKSARSTLIEPRVICLSPQGRRLTQKDLRAAAHGSELVLVCGRYEGIDERLIVTEADEEWSIGDYVLCGGELAAMVVVDAIARLIPGALGHEGSAGEDSFTQGLLDCPHYTRPEEVDGLRVPEVLLAGNHEAIRRWRLKQALGRTWLRRPDLIGALKLDDERQSLLDEFVREYDQSSV